MQKISFVYAYHLPQIKSIKVGFGDNPKQRMLAYTAKYNISPAHQTLKTWDMPSPGVAANVESSCHAALLKYGFKRSSLSDGENEASEIFYLGEFSYDDALSIVVDAIDDYITYLRKSLEGKNFGQSFRQERKGDEVMRERERRKEKSVRELKEEISAGYREYYTNYLMIEKQYSEHNRQFNHRQAGIFDRMLGRDKTEAEQFLEWSGFEKSINFVPLILKSSRPAREFFHYIHEKNSYSLIEEAQKRVGIDLWCPNGFQLPVPYKGLFRISNQRVTVSQYDPSLDYGGPIDMAVGEVLYCFRAPINRFRAMRDNKVLSDLIEWARAHPPIESTLPDLTL